MFELPVHRYRELKHFCLQYPEFKRIYDALCMPHDGETERVAIDKTEYEHAIRLIEMTAWDVSHERYEELMVSVTKDTGYKELKELRMKFFWMLSRTKGL